MPPTASLIDKMPHCKLANTGTMDASEQKRVLKPNRVQPIMRVKSGNIVQIYTCKSEGTWSLILDNTCIRVYTVSFESACNWKYRQQQNNNCRLVERTNNYTIVPPVQQEGAHLYWILMVAQRQLNWQFLNTNVIDIDCNVYFRFYDDVPFSKTSKSPPTPLNHDMGPRSNFSTSASSPSRNGG